MTKQEAAIAYAQKGWKVFPCAPNTKIPLAGAVPHGVKDATDNIETIVEWWNKNPEANIGLACGAVSGVWVVDVDVRFDKGVDGFKSIEEAGKTLPPTLSQKTPSGGRHFLYRCEGERPANKNGFLHGVDIRGDGYYIVIAPSIIDGRSYEWITDGSGMVEYPDDFKPLKFTTSSVFTAIPSVCTTPSIPIIDRARAYLAEIPGAVEHLDGHAKLFWVAQVLVNGFRLPDDTVEELMWNEYNPRCVPPWTRNASTEREFRHKITEAHKKPNPEACSIYNAVNPTFDFEEFDFDRCIEDVRALIAPKIQPVVTKDNPLSRQEVMINQLLFPDGLVGDIAKWMNDTAGCYQPKFSLAAALTLCGAIMGRKVCDESNGRTNIFCMGVGHSSCGKDHPGDCINRILTAAGAQHLLMGRMTSDSAIEKALSLSPVKIAVLDEVGHFFSTINSAGDGSAYLKTIKPTLMELFSSAHKTYIGKEKATGNPAVIDQPCVCIWGVTAPQKLYSGMTIEELQDGWIARNLIFISESRPQYVMKPSADVPEKIVESVRAWVTRSSGEVMITATAGGTSKPLVVPLDQDARIVFDHFATHAHDLMIEANKRGDKTEYLWGKAFQNARRIALIVACGKEYENPVIGKSDADYGCRLIEYLVREAEKSIAENVSENRYENEKMRILHIIEKAGYKGISKSELTRRTQWLKDNHARNLYLSDLTDAEKVRCVTVGKKITWFTFQDAERYELSQGVEHVDAE